MTDWSELQKAVFHAIEHERKSYVVNAVAGSGKTTTIVEGASRVPPGQACCFLAFNRSIANELRNRLPAHFDAKTLNGLGFGSCLMALRRQGRHFSDPGDVMDDKKVSKLLFEVFEHAQDVIEDRGPVMDTVALAKAYALSPIDEYVVWERMVKHHNVYGETLPDYEIIKAAKILLEENNDYTDFLDFNDQIYLPIIKGWPMKRYDVIFVDEAQDLSRAQLLLIKKALRPGGRVIAVGDRAQAIYGWRGASHDSLDQLSAMFDCDELPLSICYRCPTSVIEIAKCYVPEIEAREGAPEGEVKAVPWITPEQFEPTDLIVCRNNAPTISMAYSLISKRVACRVMGRDIGEGLVRLIKRFETNDLDVMAEKLRTWADKEIRRLIKAEREQAAETVRDQERTLEVIMDSSRATDVQELMGEIQSLFRNQEELEREPQMVTLATVHKAKGLEAPRVFILEPDLMPARWASQEWEQAQERNLIYVATTRPQQALYYVTVDSLVDEIPSPPKEAEIDTEPTTEPEPAAADPIPPREPDRVCVGCTAVYTPSETSQADHCGNCPPVTPS